MSLAMKLLMASANRGLAALIDRTTGTNIGDMTANAGLAAAFDGVTNQPDENSAEKGGGVASSGSAYIGKTMAVPTAIESVHVYGTSDHGYAQGADPSITITLFGKQGSAPANSGDGTVLGSSTFTDAPGDNRVINSSDTATYWNHVWIRITHTDGTPRDLQCAELQMTGWIT